MDFFSKYFDKEGKRKILILSFILFLSIFFIPSTFLKLLIFVIFLFSIYIYYIPQNRIEHIEKDAVFSPVDGKVIEKKEKENGYIVKIYNSLLDNGAILSPIPGKIEDISIVRGAFLDLSSKKSEKLNERISFKIKGEKIDLKIDSISDKMGFLGYNFYKNENQEIDFNTSLGFASNAIYRIVLPKNIELCVNVGDQLTSGISRLGFIKEKVE